MTAAYAGPPPALFALARSDELARDIEAVARRCDAVDIAAVWTRPGVLRRVASQVAESLPAGVDRVVSHVDDLPLLVAVSLHSGVPYAAVDHDHDHGIQGELYPEETALVVRASSNSEGRQVINAALRRRVQIAKVVTAIQLEPPANPPDEIDHDSVFDFRDGHLHPGDGL